MKPITFFGAAATVLALATITGCASVAVSDDALQRNTATALSATPGSFTITNRVDSGVKTTYDVATTNGQKYNCYVTGGVSVVGRVVSDAVCKPAVATAPGATTPPPQAAANCNALLKAAGRC